jgi:hypothetical protein
MFLEVPLIRIRALFLSILAAALVLSACAPAAQATPAPAENADVNLQPVKDYSLTHAASLQSEAQALAEVADEYYTLIAAFDFDYAAAWAARSQELSALSAQAKQRWLAASTAYEVNEGIIAGVPSLAQFDVWIDAGPSGAEDPAEAYDWTLELPDGRKLEKPGNLFHSLLEPAVWGTLPEFTGLAVDLNGDGQIVTGEALPEANLFKAAAHALSDAAGQMQAAVQAWSPTREDAFTALAVMIPTMNEYFEQWKLSAFVSGEAAGETAFVGISRLFDVNGILQGLALTYANLSPLVAASDAALDAQIQSGFDSLTGYVSDLYTREKGGERFSTEQADLYGSEAQERADALVGQVMQAAGLLNVEVAE